MFDEWCRRQHGVITRWQALAGGHTRSMIEQRVSGGRWRRLAHGIYATRPGPLDRPGELWAAVLTAGSGAMLSHYSAAEAAGLTAGGLGPIHVTVPAGRHPQHLPGVVVHRSRRASSILHPRRSPPQTRPEETVLDLWEAADRLDEALDWVALACGRGLTTPEKVLLTVGLRDRVRRRPELMAALRDVETGCRSGLELRYLRDVERAHALPEGERWPCGSPAARETDWSEGVVYYPAFRTSVHLGPQPALAVPPAGSAPVVAWEPPDGVLRGGVLRYGDVDVLERACQVADQVAVALRGRGWRRYPRRCSPSCGAVTP